MSTVDALLVALFSAFVVFLASAAALVRLGAPCPLCLDTGVSRFNGHPCGCEAGRRRS